MAAVYKTQLFFFTFQLFFLTQATYPKYIENLSKFPMCTGKRRMKKTPNAVRHTVDSFSLPVNTTVCFSLMMLLPKQNIMHNIYLTFPAVEGKSNKSVRVSQRSQPSPLCSAPGTEL